MFSKARFNHTVYSRVQDTNSLAGGEARAITTAQGSFRAVRYMSAVANAVTNQISYIVRGRFLSSSVANALSGTVRRAVTRIRFFGGTANALTETWGGSVVSVIIFTFSMPDLVMQDGDVLQIDTGEYTVTLNGNNAVYLVTDLSEFFRLEPDQGTIHIEFDDNGTADIRILWKERYM